MRSRVFLKVGLILIISTSAFAESIPFDFLFGRMTGGQYLRVNYHDNKNAKAFLDGWFRGGMEDRFTFDIGRFVYWVPNVDENRVRWKRNPFQGSFQLNGSTRYSVNQFDWQDNYRVVSSPNDVLAVSNDSKFSLDQSLTYLRNGAIEYQEDKSLFLYLRGRSLNRGDLLVEANLNLDIRDSEYQVHRELTPFQMRWQVGEDNSRNLSVSASPQYGFSDWFQGGLHVQYFQRKNERSNGGLSYQILEPGGTIDTSFHSKSESEYTYTFVHLTPQATLILRPNLWVKGNVGLRFFGQDSKSAYASRGLFDEHYATHRTFYKRDETTYYAGLATTWISRMQQIPLQRVLDNYTPRLRAVPRSAMPITNSPYYGRQLESRSLRFDTKFYYVHKHRGGTTRYKKLESEFRIMFFPVKTFSVENRFHLTRGVEPGFIRGIEPGYGTEGNFQHSQIYDFNTTIRFYSYSWDKDKRRDISWQQVSDIDYLLGPLLRRYDWRASLTIDWPDNHWGDIQESERLFNFYKGDFNWNRTASVNGSYGILDKLDAGLTLTWRQWGHYYFIREYDAPLHHQWSLVPVVSWQPRDFCRVTASATESWYRYEFSDNSHHWQFDLQLDIVL